jgi:DNA helicase-2/ATP-dependent DNA helicase PcrA
MLTPSDDDDDHDGSRYTASLRTTCSRVGFRARRDSLRARLVDLAKLLSPSQLEAATRIDRPVCILAGAGSGKTRVITHRISWLMTQKRERAESILAVTFTNKAAGEMRERVEKLVPGRAARVLLGTFHGLAARLLRRFGRIVDVNPNFVIYDADDAERLLQRLVMNDLNRAKDACGPIGRLIDSWQCEGLSPSEVPVGHDLLFTDALAAYRLYQTKLQEASALDFGGLLVKLRELVTHPDGATALGHVRHILVDEYQDVNRVQADIVLALAHRAATVAVVGDDDQAIYGWRGASADNLKKFLVALPGATVVKLEENYRSTPAILEAANGIIAHNEVRLGKVLRPAGDQAHRERGRLVRIVRGNDDIEEARRIGSLLVEHVMSGTALDDIAILYRANAQSRTMEDELRRLALPYRVVGGVRFYDRKEVKDVLATIRAALNRRSDVDALRFLSAVPRGIGDASLKKIDAKARERRVSLLHALADPALLQAAGLAAGTQKKCAAVITILDALAAKIGRPAWPPSQETGATGRLDFDGASATTTSDRPVLGPLGAKDALALAVEASGVAERLAAEGGLEAESRLENLAELVNAAATFEQVARRNGEASDLEAFLENAALLGSADDNPRDDGRGQVTLMTLHAAKGLEFDVVFLVGLEEHGFPHSRAVLADDDGSLEEERRLAYVGITRARRRLVLSYAARRMVQGVVKGRDPSRFLFEIPRGVVEGDVPRRGHERSSSSSLLDVWRQRRESPASRWALGSDDDDGHGTRIVYDDDTSHETESSWGKPRTPRGSRTRLLPVAPESAEDAGSFSSSMNGPSRFASREAPQETGDLDQGKDVVVVREDEPSAAPSARRFRLSSSPMSSSSEPLRAGLAAPDAMDEGGDGVDAAGHFGTGDRVFHRLFGDGTVVGARGGGRGAQHLLVRFDSERAPRLVVSRHLKTAPVGERP